VEPNSVTNSGRLVPAQRNFQLIAAHESITVQSQYRQGENTVKRLLFVLGIAVLFANTLMVPTVVRADGSGGGSTNCGGGSVCKP
jgi:hypothetical protein